MLKTLLLSCAVLCASSAGAQDYSTVLSLVQQWAPRVWLHPEEEFMPYNVSDYLNKVTPTYINCSTPTNCSYPSSIIPVGTDSQGYYLVTQDNRDDLLKDNSSFLYGVSPNVKNSSLPAFVTSCDSNNQHFIVTYWFFYGFDKGKRVINLGVFGQLPFIRDLNMRYLSKSAECHVGDLERMVLEIKDGVPKTLFLSVHSIGVYYDYDPTDGYFKVSSSKTKSMLKVLNPPKRLELVDGHPVIFSALGSHGVWASKDEKMMQAIAILLLSILCIAGTHADSSAISALVKQWAPRVWFHPEETFYPCDVLEYLNKVTPTIIKCSDSKTCSSTPSSSIPSGSESYGYYLVTNEDKGVLLNDSSSFLYGTNPSVKQNPVHGFVTECDSSGANFIVTYWFFYSFDSGKQIIDLGKFGLLPVIRELNKHVGKHIGRHVGDFEEMSIEFENGVPKSLFLSLHGIGTFYKYDSSSGNFKYAYSKSKKMLKINDPPESVEVVDGHPVIFASLGSHGLWASAGDHTYSKFGKLLFFLTDETDKGTAWDTWNNLNVYSTNPPSWYNYLGAWGNPESDCVSVPLIDADVCEFGNGPGGLASRTPSLSC